MKFIISAFALMGAASLSFGQTASPSATADKAKVSDAQAGTPARTDVYHVHFAKSALGKAAQHADSLKKQDPKAPMPGHYVMFRHQDGDAWDYCVIEHLGTKATVEAVRPPLPAGQRDLNEWHTDTYCNGPAWADFARALGLDDSGKSTGSAYVVSVYRPAPGQRDALDKMLNEPPNRPTDTSSGNIVLQHLEGAAWTFLAIARYNSWDDFAKNEMNSIAQTNKNEGGWLKLRDYVSYHTDTVCDRVSP